MRKNDLAFALELVFKRKVDLVDVREAASDVALQAFAQGSPIFIRRKREVKKDYLRHFYQYDDQTNLRALKAKRVKEKFSNG